MRVGFVVFALALGACNPQPAAFTPDVERNFMMACVGQGSSNALCSCTWDKIEANISPGDFAALERMPGPQRESHPLTAQIAGFVETCNVSLTRQVEPAPDDPVPEP
jgi:hypothetical protein